LGVSFAVLGWICMMLFEWEGAFLPKRTTGGNWRELEVRSIIILGLQAILLL
jgi:hypothetical protein